MPKLGKPSLAFFLAGLLVIAFALDLDKAYAPTLGKHDQIRKTGSKPVAFQTSHLPCTLFLTACQNGTVRHCHRSKA